MCTAAELSDAAASPSARHAACQSLALGWAAKTYRGCPTEKHGCPFLLLLLSRQGQAPYGVAVVGLILQALGFHLTRASEDGYLQPRTSKQGGEGDNTCGGAGNWWLSGAPAAKPFPRSAGPAACKRSTLPCSSPARLRGGIGFSASEKASQLLKSLIHDDKEGTED